MTSLLSRCMLFQPLGVDQCPFRDTCSHRLENRAMPRLLQQQQVLATAGVDGDLSLETSLRKTNLKEKETSDRETRRGSSGPNSPAKTTPSGAVVLATERSRPRLGEERLHLPCRRPVLNQRTLPTGSPDTSRVAGGRCKTCCCCVGSRQELPPTAGGRARSRWYQTDSAGLFPAAYDAAALY